MGETQRLGQEEAGSGIVPAATRVRPVLECRDLDCHLLSPRGDDCPPLRAAFSVWHQVWTDTMAKLEGTSRVDSDEFTRQDEIGVFMRADECIGMVGFRFVNLSLPQFREDSYFHAWPTEVLDRIAGRWLCLMGNNTVAVPWRGGVVQPPPGASATDLIALKEMAIRLSLLRFLNSRAEGFIGSPRNDRNLQRVAYGLGATKLAQVTVHGVETDLVLFERDAVTDLGPTVHELWERRTEHGGSSLDV